MTYDRHAYTKYERSQIMTTDATITTKQLAPKYNLKGTQLRRILRTMPAYADGVHTNYAWHPVTDKAALAQIDAAVKAIADKRAKRAADAKAALATPAAK